MAADRQLEFDARHDGLGHVTPGVTLKSWQAADRDGAWSARVVFTVESGEQMRQLAADVTSLLGWGLPRRSV